MLDAGRRKGSDAQYQEALLPTPQGGRPRHHLRNIKTILLVLLACWVTWTLLTAAITFAVPSSHRTSPLLGDHHTWPNGDIGFDQDPEPNCPPGASVCSVHVSCGSLARIQVLLHNSWMAAKHVVLQQRREANLQYYDLSSTGPFSLSLQQEQQKRKQGQQQVQVQQQGIRWVAVAGA
jgi:hypothetical protein